MQCKRWNDKMTFTGVSGKERGKGCSWSLNSSMDGGKLVKHLISSFHVLFNDSRVTTRARERKAFAWNKCVIQTDAIMSYSPRAPSSLSMCMNISISIYRSRVIKRSQLVTTTTPSIYVSLVWKTRRKAHSAALLLTAIKLSRRNKWNDSTMHVYHCHRVQAGDPLSTHHSTQRVDRFSFTHVICKVSINWWIIRTATLHTCCTLFTRHERTRRAIRRGKLLWLMSHGSVACLHPRQQQQE